MQCSGLSYSSISVYIQIALRQVVSCAQISRKVYIPRIADAQKADEQIADG